MYPCIEEAAPGIIVPMPISRKVTGESFKCQKRVV
jgi:hypothetical protein